EANDPVTGAINEQGSLKTQAATAASVEGFNGGDLFAILDDLVGAVIEIEVDQFLGLDDFFLDVVSKFLRLTRGSGGFVGEFLDNFADTGKLASADQPLSPDAD